MSGEGRKALRPYGDRAKSLIAGGRRGKGLKQFAKGLLYRSSFSIDEESATETVQLFLSEPKGETPNLHVIWTAKHHAIQSPQLLRDLAHHHSHGHLVRGVDSLGDGGAELAGEALYGEGCLRVVRGGDESEGGAGLRKGANDLRGEVGLGAEEEDAFAGEVRDGHGVILAPV